MFTAILHLALQQAVICCLRICNLLLSSSDTLNSYNTDMLCLALLCAFCDEHVNFFPSSSRECYVYMNKCLHYSECTEVGIYSLSLSRYVSHSLSLPPLPHFICHGPNLSYRRAEKTGCVLITLPARVLQAAPRRGEPSDA